MPARLFISPHLNMTLYRTVSLPSCVVLLLRSLSLPEKRQYGECQHGYQSENKIAAHGSMSFRQEFLMHSLRWLPSPMFGAMRVLGEKNIAICPTFTCSRLWAASPEKTISFSASYCPPRVCLTLSTGAHPMISDAFQRHMDVDEPTMRFQVKAFSRGINAGSSALTLDVETSLKLL